jgi:hypothetical protein
MTESGSIHPPHLHPLQPRLPPAASTPRLRDSAARRARHRPPAVVPSWRPQQPSWWAHPRFPDAISAGDPARRPRHATPDARLFHITPFARTLLDTPTGRGVGPSAVPPAGSRDRASGGCGIPGSVGLRRDGRRSASSLKKRGWPLTASAAHRPFPMHLRGPDPKDRAVRPAASGRRSRRHRGREATALRVLSRFLRPLRGIRPPDGGYEPARRPGVPANISSSSRSSSSSSAGGREERMGLPATMAPHAVNMSCIQS